MKTRLTLWANPALRTYIATTLFLGGITFFGFAGLGLSRQLYMLGCIWLGVMAWRDSPGRHLEVTIILFAFSPFVRRVVDAGSGFDPLGLMLSGPLLTMLVPCIDLRNYVRRSNAFKGAGPYILCALCISYGTMISVFSGDFQPIMIQLLKWGTPLLYGLWMLTQSRDPRNNIIDHAARAFLIVTPVMGVYGVLQYLDPAPWDRLWMVYSKMDSIGFPEPFGVRVFSTMNSPASFATFATAGLLVFSFTRRGYQAALIGGTVALALMLSQYRTAWIAMAIGICYAWLYPRTRGKATGIAVFALVAAIVGMTSGGPIGDVISQRFDTLSEGAKDGSAVERIGEYIGLYDMIDQYIVGKGFILLGIENNTGLVALDGTILASILVMGLFVGTVFLLSLCWLAIQAVSNIKMDDSPVRVSTGAVVLGLILTMPLAGITSGETGFLFYTFVAIATGSPKESLRLSPMSFGKIPNKERTEVYRQRSS